MINPNAELEKAQDCLRRGDFKRALKLSKSLSRAVPKSPVPLNIAGIALTGLNKPADSLSYFKKAIAIEPGFHDARKNAAQALVSMGKPDKALQWLEVPKKQTPGDPVVWYLMTQCRMGLNQPDKAMEAVNTVIDLQPGQARGYFLRARVFLQIGYLRDAISDLEKVLEIDPSNIAAMTEISLPLARQLRSDEALAVVEKAVSLRPDASPARLRLASQLVETGRGPEAVLQYQEVLKSDPGNAFALESLVELLDGDDVAGLEEAAMRALKSAPRRSEERATLQYALYRILQKSNDPARAARHLADANRDMASILPYDYAADRGLTETLLNRFPVAGAKASDTGDKPLPVFIVGLPRSGTTLAEAILGAHPDVAALGEQGTAGALLAPLINENRPFDDAAILEFRSQFERQRPDLPDGTIACVDKMPENYRLVGFLKSAYPGCRIIHIERDPRDVALSMWKAHFSGSALSYTYDLKSMAQKFNLYARMMGHWQRLYGDDILRISYEDMTRNIEETSKRIADHCQLRWTARMARPDLAAGQVLTKSATQIRQPVHTRSIGAWQKHQDLLEPFLGELDKALWGLEQPVLSSETG